ncbi:MAG: PPOX class F420-dependent oxidoreductase [Nitrosopumilus sp.]|nr:PPOX class F420-dependent oxidoreductase [Nitrosopumilus sp.]MDH5658021.1 PPOX class F420-dependent oxidoreductase [Nitrosopumilus sp.]
MSALKDLESKKYISLETYKKNREPVRTPVWFVIRDDFIQVITRERTGKVKRIKNNQQVKIATCTIRGKITGEWMSGIAKIMTGVEADNAVRLRDRKYGFATKIAKFASRNKGKFVAFNIKLD